MKKRSFADMQQQRDATHPSSSSLSTPPRQSTLTSWVKSRRNDGWHQCHQLGPEAALCIQNAFFTRIEADRILAFINHLRGQYGHPFQRTQVNIGAPVPTYTSALQALYGLDEVLGYSYAGQSISANPIPHELREVINKVNQHLSSDFNAVLINVYEGPKAHVGAHQDTRSGISGPDVAAISLGGQRVFRVTRAKPKYPGEIVKDVATVHGQLMLMEGE